MATSVNHNPSLTDEGPSDRDRVQLALQTDEAERTISSHRRKIIVCCDGTWNNDISDRPLTNVSRFARCVKPLDEQCVPQVVFYQPGVGTGTSKVWNVVEGATGKGLYENIQQAYGFLCHNYATSDDEIHLVGFSRGAFTVRCVAQLISDVGLLTKTGLVQLRKLFKLWKKREHQELSKELTDKGSSRQGIRIKTCAVWDTVGSLGRPAMAFGLEPQSRKLKFVNSDLCGNIDKAIQALSLSEHRRHFQAIVWRKRASNTTDRSDQSLKQCWFFGYHSDVGGGNEDGALAHLAMVWIMDQLAGHLDFRFENLWLESTEDGGAPVSPAKKRLTEVVAKKEGMSLEYRSFGVKYWVSYHRVLTVKVKESMRGVFLLGGSKTRRPCQYFWDKDGLKLEEPMASDSCEEVHFSVRALLAKKLIVPCHALDRAEVKIGDSSNDDGDGNEKTSGATWTFKGKKSGASYTMPEAKSSPQEIDVLGRWLRAEETDFVVDDIHRPRPPAPQDSLARAIRPILEQGSQPSQPWSAEEYRKDVRWRVTAGVELGSDIGFQPNVQVSGPPTS